MPYFPQPLAMAGGMPRPGMPPFPQLPGAPRPLMGPRGPLPPFPQFALPGQPGMPRPPLMAPHLAQPGMAPRPLGMPGALGLHPHVGMAGAAPAAVAAPGAGAVLGAGALGTPAVQGALSAELRNSPTSREGSPDGALGAQPNGLLAAKVRRAPVHSRPLLRPLLLPVPRSWSPCAR